MAVRNESVRLSLQDDFSTGMAKVAAQTALLRRELDRLNNRNVAVARSTTAVAPQLDRMGSSARNAGNALDSFSGRTGIALDLLLALGPAAVATGAMAAPAMTTLASGVGAVGVAAVGTAVAFGGVGEAIETMNKAHLEPTKENLQEARVAMERLAPAAQGFVRQLDSMRALGMEIRDAGQQGLFPGLTDALESLERRGPDAVRIIEKINREVGDLARDGAESLAGPRWDDFFRMVERQAPRALDTMGRALGDVLHGVSEIMEAFAPTSRDGLEWIADAADDFDRWATGLKRSDDFRDFINYVREVGPQVADTAGAIAEAVGDIATAAAPLGGVALQGLEGLASAASAIADSGMGTELVVAVGAMRAMRRVGGLAGVSGPGGIVAAARAGGPGAALSVATGVVPVFVTNPGFGRPGTPGVVPGGTPGGRGSRSGPGLAPLAFGGPFGWAAAAASGVWALGNSDWARRGGFGDPLPDFKPTAPVESLGDLPINDATFDIHARIDEDEAARVRAEIEKITAKPYTASVDLEDQRARRVAQGVHRMLDDVASQRPTPKIDADPAPATGKSNGVKRLLDEIGNKRPRPKIDANDNASPVINRVSGLLASLDGRNANTTVTTTYVTRRVNEGSDASGGTNFGARIKSAAGNIIDYYAAGDIRNRHTAQIAPAGAWRVWAEDETGGEAYIPLANDWRRDRAVSIWQETGRRLGQFAEGGLLAARMPAQMGSGGGAGSVSVNLNGMKVTGTLQTPWGPAQIEGVARQAARSEIDAQARWDREQAGG